MTTLVLILLLVCTVALTIHAIVNKLRISELKRELASTEYHLSVKTNIARKQHLEIKELHKENRDLTEKLQKSYYRDKKGRIRKYQGE